MKSLGRRLTVNDKRLVARKLAALSPSALKTAEIEVAPAVVLRVGPLTRDAVERAERYAADRDAFIEVAEGVQGGRPVIKGTRLTVSAIHGRLSSGDTIETLLEDYPDIPRGAFEAALLYAKTHPQVGRPVLRHAGIGGVKFFIDECISPSLSQHLNRDGLHDAIHPRDSRPAARSRLRRLRARY